MLIISGLDASDFLKDDFPFFEKKSLRILDFAFSILYFCRRKLNKIFSVII